MVLRDSDHCFEAFSGYSLAVRSTETPGNRDDLTDFCPVLRAGTKADLEKNFRGRSSGPYGRFAAWRAGREFYWKRYLNRSVGNADLNKKICGHMKKAPSHEDAFISFPYLVKGGLSSLNETGS
jgi:hypothetical protein